jgi:glycosyltransferase involved in cell wall biosynthesis
VDKKPLPRVVMLGPARNVHGGVSTMVNNLYAAGLTEQVNLTYIATMVDGSKIRKLFRAIGAYLRFLAVLPCIDIVHVLMSADASYYRKKVFIDTAFLFRKKIVIGHRGGDFQPFYYNQNARRQKRMRQTLNKAQVFLVLSPEWKEFFLPLVVPEKIEVLENGVTLPKRKKMDYKGQKLLFLGRICYVKGIKELLDIIPRLKERFPAVSLCLGGVWDSNELKRQADELGETIEFVGWLDKEGREKYYDQCAIFVLPTYYEGQPNSLLEAMAAGMPVIASEVRGVPHLVKDGINGRMIPPKDREALYNALVELLESEELRRKYGEAARKDMETRFSMKEWVEMLCTVYERVMEK